MLAQHCCNITTITIGAVLFIIENPFLIQKGICFLACTESKNGKLMNELIGNLFCSVFIFKSRFEVKWSESRSVVSDSLRLHGLYSPWNSPGKNTGVGSHSLLEGIFPTQGLNPGSPTLWADSLPDEPQGKPRSRFGVWFYVLMEVIFLFLSALWVIDIKNDIWYMKSCVRNFWKL